MGNQTITVVVIPAAMDREVELREIACDSDRAVLRALQNAVGGYLDVVRVMPGVDLWVDDEGLLKDRQYNARACQVVTALKWAVQEGAFKGWPYIDPLADAQATERSLWLVGDAVLAGSNAAGETVSVPDDVLAFMRKEMLLDE